MLQTYIEKLISGESLTLKESEAAGAAMINGADPVQTGAFLALLKAKGETADELVGLVEAMRKAAVKVALPFPTVDIVGTGGDRAGTVNISTGSALLAAACGVPVVKHGNRAVSSKSGSADVLEELGFDLHEDVLKSLAEKNFAFCFAPDYHPALKNVRGVRHSLKIPSAFNLLGPLLNPAGIEHLQLGVYSTKLVVLIAEALHRLGTRRSLVFHGHGLDELSCIGPVDALLVEEKGISPLRIDPAKLGLAPCTLEDLKGGSAQDNAEILRRALSGAPSRISDTLILNAAVAQFLYGSVSSLEEGVIKAREALAKGVALPKNILRDIAKRKKIERPKKSLKEALKKSALIAEIKRASPSKGEIGEIRSIRERAENYAKGGASALSILTDSAFSGSVEDLREAAHLPLPILRKDFIVDLAQLFESLYFGADAVLLIAALLKGRLKEFIDQAKILGLETLVEVHNEEELELALAAGAEIIGVNQRNLADFSMHPELFQKLVEKIPSGKIKIAESGLTSPEEVRAAYDLGYNAVLVGEALTRSQDPELFIRGCHAH
ncbi:MAG: anthranilate phosphoribosyltransferase [Verrucomicrobia bacterium]|nr:anthranilate phosphoribosyltransferase [Verrucomicrobiota bacterium]